MKDDDLIKNPTSVYGNGYKIRYDTTGLGGGSNASSTFIMIGIVFVAIPVIMIVRTLNENGMSFGDIPLYMYGMLVVFASIPILLAIYAKSQEKKFAKDRQEFCSKGRRVTGKIVEIGTEVTGAGRSRTVHYFFKIEYKHPDTGEICKHTTPYLLSCPHIHNDDLPLDASIILLEDKVYADEILNPPFEKIATRKKYSALVSYTLIFGIAASMIFACLQWQIAASIALVITIGLIIAISIKNAKR